ncbi:MAG: DUF2490 domain-containing protein [Opitutales bacterium]
MKHLITPLLITIVGMTLTPLHSRAQYDGDVRIWQELMIREYKGDRFQAYTWAELRYFDDASRLGLWFVQQKLYYKVNPHLSVGTGPAWIEVEGSNGIWNTMARWEFELNPTVKFEDGSSIQFRNRLETRWWESRDFDTEFVSRHRIRYSRPADWFPRMKRFEMSNEFFFDYRTGSYSENRLRLFDMHFDAFEKTTANTFFQIRSRRPGGRGDWQHAYIIGFGFRFLP